MSEDVQITVRIRKANLDALTCETLEQARKERGHLGSALMAQEDGTYRLLLLKGTVPEPAWDAVGVDSVRFLARLTEVK